MKTTDHPLYEPDIRKQRQWHRATIARLTALLEKYQAEERELTRRIEKQEKDTP